MQLVYLIHRWLQALEKGHNVTAIFLDFKKAFDRVCHHGLLHKLLTCGISPKSVTWISSYCKVTNFRTVFIFVHFVLLKKYEI